MKVRILRVAAAALSLVSILSTPVWGQGTAFSYQGSLKSGGVAVSGNFDLTFELYTAAAGGTAAGFETNTAVAVSNSLFTTTLNFSNAFNGTAYWLEIGVRTNGSTNAFTILSPRQPLTPTPYAITASNLTGVLSAAQLTGSIPATVISGTFSNSVSFTNSANVFAGNGSGLFNVPGVTSSNYLYAFDSTVQYLSSAGAFQNVSLGTTYQNGWLVPATTEFVPEQSGVYLVQYQAHFFNGSGSSAYSAMLRMLNTISGTPTEISSSEAVITVPPDYLLEVSRSFVVALTTSDYLTLQFTASAAGSGGVSLYSSSFVGQFFPSVALTIIRIQ